MQGEQLSAGEVAQINAYRKARVVAKKHPDAVVLGVDTVVALGGALLGKPATLGEAAQMLLTLQGKTHWVVTGVCVLHLRLHRQVIFCERTAVTFRALTEEQIRRYHAEVNPLDKAGAYGIQEKGEMLVESHVRFLFQRDGSAAGPAGGGIARLRHRLQSRRPTAVRGMSLCPWPGEP